MAYVSGTTSSFQDFKTAIENALTSNGWTLNSGILSKSGAFIQLVANTNTGTTPAPAAQERYKLVAYMGTGQSGTSLTGSDPLEACCMANPQHASAAAAKITFPANYEIYTFENPTEVHIVLNYNSDFYQFLAFGVSDVPGIGGTGMWGTGTFGREIDTVTNANCGKCFMSNAYDSVRTDAYGGVALPYFFRSNNSPSANSNLCGAIHCGLDSVGWKTQRANSGETGVWGIGSISGLLQSLPSPYNQAAVLLPARIVKARLQNGQTIVANIKNARITRNDNIQAGEVIAYGAERWKVYPLYRRSTVNRNGIGWSTGDYASGTFAVALRYEGP